MTHATGDSVADPEHLSLYDGPALRAAAGGGAEVVAASCAPSPVPPTTPSPPFGRQTHATPERQQGGRKQARRCRAGSQSAPEEPLKAIDVVALPIEML